MQWGGQRFLNPNGSRSAFALGSFLSTITQRLEVEVVRDWSTGHDEYWGKLGHFAIGWKACDDLSGHYRHAYETEPAQDRFWRRGSEQGV